MTYYNTTYNSILKVTLILHVHVETSQLTMVACHGSNFINIVLLLTIPLCFVLYLIK